MKIGYELSIQGDEETLIIRFNCAVLSSTISKERLSSLVKSYNGVESIKGDAHIIEVKKNQYVLWEDVIRDSLLLVSEFLNIDPANMVEYANL